MPIPTISSASPPIGDAHGGYLLQINGSNFQLAHPGISYRVNPGVSVEINGVVATDTRVYSATQVVCRVPSFVGDPLATEPGAATVRVANLDNGGAEVPGEVVQSALVFSYQRTRLTGDSRLTSVARSVIETLKRQLLVNTAPGTSVDYDDTPDDDEQKIAVAQLPALVISGPTPMENRLHSLAEDDPRDVPVDRYEQERAPRTVDLEFDIRGLSDNKVELINLQEAVIRFFESNKHLKIPVDPNAPDGEKYELELEIVDDPAMVPRSGIGRTDDVQEFLGTFVVVGFDVELTGILERGYKTKTLVTSIGDTVVLEEELGE